MNHITAEELRTLRPGDRVKIVDQWLYHPGYQNTNGKMDHWLGKIMTVRSRYNLGVKMVEDVHELNGDGWSWNHTLIERVLPPEDDVVFNTDAIDSFLCDLVF